MNDARHGETAALEEFLFRATSAWLALADMKFREQRCVQQFQHFKDQLTLNRRRIVFSSLDLFQLFHQFTPFMSSMRFLQNMILRMVGRRLQLGTSIPQSLREAIPKLETYKLPAGIVKLVADYWQAAGRHLKDYRDLDQHYFALTKHTFLEWEPNERIVIVLPDNPDVHSASQLTFAKNINALNYFQEAFESFHDLVEAVCKELGFADTDIKEELYLEHFGKLEKGVKQTIALWMDDPSLLSAFEVGQTDDCRIYCRKVVSEMGKELQLEHKEGVTS